MPAGGMSCSITSFAVPDRNPGERIFFFPGISKKMSLPEFLFSWCAPFSHSRRLIRQHQSPPNTPVHIFFFSRTHKKAANAPSTTSTMRMRTGGFSRWYSRPDHEPLEKKAQREADEDRSKDNPGCEICPQDQTHCPAIGAH
jgi:hypothetical protein